MNGFTGFDCLSEQQERKKKIKPRSLCPELGLLKGGSFASLKKAGMMEEDWNALKWAEVRGETGAEVMSGGGGANRGR